jgi:hypothetical protein
MDELVITCNAEHTPDVALPVDYEFCPLFTELACDGALVAARSNVAVVGLARDIAGILPMTLQRLSQTVKHFAGWKCIVVENDSTDDTKALLKAWAAEHSGHVVLELLDNGRPHLHGFERERVMALADYRNRCRELVREHYPEADYVVAVDLDAWGGWSVHGLLNGIGWHQKLPKAGCMASTSLFKHAGTLMDGKTPWAHYDNWAYRWLGWTPRIGPWFTFWLPPPGAPPIPVNSAFGGLAIYNTQPYLEAAYSGDNGDCEHVSFHRIMQSKGWSIFLNPAQRCVMSWLADEDEEPSDGGRKHGDDQH